MRALFILILFVLQGANSQNDFINIKHNKILCTLSFIDAAAGGLGSSPSYEDLITEALKNDANFQQILSDYKTLNFYDVIEREGFPKKRRSQTSVQDLLWIASASSKDLEDFSSRSFGILTPAQHKVLIDVLQKSTPYYETLVWSTTSDERQSMEQALRQNRSDITEIFKKTKHFLGSSWDTEIPFNIMLYPIPLARGATTAVPKGNNLICSYLSKRENEDKDILGIAIHEMNHILYDAQPLSFQKKLDEYFTTSDNPIALLAYNFFDEGLATAVGNGWAYEQLNGTLDEGSWYDVTYIDTFGKLLYPLVKEYIQQEKSIDESFIKKSINLFSGAYPNATTDLGILMNNVHLFAQSADEINVNNYFNAIAQNFTLRSANFIYPLDEGDALSKYKELQQTKIIVLDEKIAESSQFLSTIFEDFPKMDMETSSLTAFLDPKTSSPVIVIFPKTQEDFGKLMALLKEEGNIIYGKRITVN